MEDWLTSCWPADQQQQSQMHNNQQEQFQLEFQDQSSDTQEYSQNEHLNYDHELFCGQHQEDRVGGASTRREKARIAARARRSQEGSVIFEMANELMISRDRMRRIDKATIVKLAIDYLKASQVLTSPSLTTNQQSHINNKTINYCQLTNHQITSSLSNQELSSARPAATIIDRRPLIETRTQINSCHSLNQTPVMQVFEEAEEIELLENELKEDNNRINQEDQKQKQHKTFIRKPLNADTNAINANLDARSNYENDQEHSRKAMQSSPRPILTTNFIFSPRTADMDCHYLMISERDDGKSSFVLKLESEIEEEDDLTHLAPQAGDMSIPLEVEPLEGIELDPSLGLFACLSSSPPTKKLAPFANRRRRPTQESHIHNHHNHHKQAKSQDFVNCKLPTEVMQ